MLAGAGIGFLHVSQLPKHLFDIRSRAGLLAVFGIFAVWAVLLMRAAFLRFAAFYLQTVCNLGGV